MPPEPATAGFLLPAVFGFSVLLKINLAIQ